MAPTSSGVRPHQRGVAVEGHRECRKKITTARAVARRQLRLLRPRAAAAGKHVGRALLAYGTGRCTPPPARCRHRGPPRCRKVTRRAVGRHQLRLLRPRGAAAGKHVDRALDPCWHPRRLCTPPPARCRRRGPPSSRKSHTTAPSSAVSFACCVHVLPLRVNT
jgi:hypothetical protein